MAFIYSYVKMVLVLNSWLLASGSPVVMLQHPTSSQSIVFQQHQAPASTPPITTTPIPASSIIQSKYEYRYEVSDPQTGDRKSHWERRNGDSVRGVYTLYEPDGAIRTVEYTADEKHGFNAVVKRNEPNKHQQSRLNEGYNYKTPSNGGTFNERSQGNQLKSDTIPSKAASKHLGTSNLRNQGVDFTIVHERNLK